MKRSMLVLAIAAFAAIASPSTTSARLSDLMETRQAQPNYAQYYYGPYRRHVRRVYRRAYRRAYYGYPYSYGGITADIAIISLIPTEDIILTPMEGIVRTISDLIVGMCVEFTVVHIDGVITNAMGRH